VVITVVFFVVVPSDPSPLNTRFVLANTIKTDGHSFDISFFDRDSPKSDKGLKGTETVKRQLGASRKIAIKKLKDLSTEQLAQLRPPSMVCCLFSFLKSEHGLNISNL
jgi:hypothetical protein